MSRSGFAQLEDVIRDPDFPDLDLALRRGRHIDRDDVAWYALLGDAQDHLEAFYRRYGCELVHKADGYYYLLPTGDRLSRRQLSSSDMLVGQALALLYLHPSTVERGGLHSHEELIAQLATVLGSDALIRAFNPKRRRYDERVAQKTVRLRVGEAVRRLAGLGFVDLVEGDQLRLRPALLRFAEPVRGLSEPAEALAQLVARGEVALEGGDSAGAAAEAEDRAEDHADDDAEDPADDGEDGAAADDSDLADGDDAGGEPAEEPAPVRPAGPSSEREGEPEEEFVGDTVIGHRRDVANPARGRKPRAASAGGKAKAGTVPRGPSNAPDRGVTVQLFDLDDDDDEPDGDLGKAAEPGGPPGGIEPGTGRKRPLTGPQRGAGPTAERAAPMPLFHIDEGEDDDDDDDEDDDEANDVTAIGRRRGIAEAGHAPGGVDPGAGRKSPLTGPQPGAGQATERRAPVPLFHVDEDDDEDEADDVTAIGYRRNAEPDRAPGRVDPGTGRKKTLTGPQPGAGHAAERGAPVPLFPVDDDDEGGEGDADGNVVTGLRREVVEAGQAPRGDETGAGRKKAPTGPQPGAGPAPLRFDLRDDDADEPNEVTEIGHRRPAEPARDDDDDAAELDGDTVLGYRRDAAGRPVPVGRDGPLVNDIDDDDGDDGDDGDPP